MLVGTICDVLCVDYITGLSVVLYHVPGWGPSLVEGAVNTLHSELQCDVRGTAEVQLQPMVTDRPQVDVIDCWGRNIYSVVDNYSITKATAGQYL